MYKAMAVNTVTEFHNYLHNQLGNISSPQKEPPHQQENGEVRYGAFIHNEFIYNSTIKRNKLLTTWVKLKYILLRKDLHTHKSAYCTFPFA